MEEFGTKEHRFRIGKRVHPISEAEVFFRFPVVPEKVCSERELKIENLRIGPRGTFSDHRVGFFSGIFSKEGCLLSVLRSEVQDWVTEIRGPKSFAHPYQKNGSNSCFVIFGNFSTSNSVLLKRFLLLLLL